LTVRSIPDGEFPLGHGTYVHLVILRLYSVFPSSSTPTFPPPSSSWVTCPSPGCRVVNAIRRKRVSLLRAPYMKCSGQYRAIFGKFRHSACAMMRAVAVFREGVGAPWGAAA